MPDTQKSDNISRRKFIGGVAGGMALGAAGAWGLSHGIDRFGRDPARLLSVSAFGTDWG